MSMIGNYRRLAPDELEHLQASVAAGEPDAVHRFLSPAWEAEDSLPLQDMEMDTDKAWAGLHFLLTGTEQDGEPPLCYVVGDKDLGSDDIGYGPPRYLTPVQVQEAANALMAVREDELRARFSPAAFVVAGIYPTNLWKNEPETVTFPYLWENAVRVRDFFQQAAQSGDAILFWVD